jgi:hypothetical protein
MPRNVTVPVFIGVLKATADSADPRIVVAKEPRAGNDFDRYKWFRSTVDITIPDLATVVPSTPATPV